jgi:hypothetical protein
MDILTGKLEIYSEVCCEECGEIVHNHFNCPICNEKYAASMNYCDLGECVKDGVASIRCFCGATFQTKEYPYDPDAIWERVTL